MENGEWRMENGEWRMENPLKDKSFEFSLKIIKIYKYLIKKNEFVLSKQILRSGTSIGANVVEANDAISKKEFRAKMSIALKEARETKYWLDLLVASEFLSKIQVEHVENLLNELISMLVKVVKNAK